MLTHVFQEGYIGSLKLKNRFVVPPMVTMYANEDGTTTERFLAYYEEKAKGGFGLVITENYAVMPNVGGFKRLPGLWSDKLMEDHKKLPDRIHQYDGAKVAAQIYHAGRETNSGIITGIPKAPSAIRDPTQPEIPEELTIDEIKEIVQAFGDAARRARQAGFDAIEIHGAHGYLINQFLSPFSNKRTDEYGGHLFNRTRFAREVIAKVKENVGDDFPVIYRMSVEEFVEGGLTIKDTTAAATILERAGIHALHASAGVYASGYLISAPAAKEHGWLTGYSEEMKKVLKIPVITVNRITDPIMADTIIASGKADYVAMGRASLADPHLPNKARENHFDDIQHCIGCMQGCIGRQALGLELACLVNPRTGREHEREIIPAKQSKNVIVIGGGPAGMEASVVAAQRGHRVTLYEQSDKLGGQWLLAAIPPNKEELNTLTLWQKAQLKKYGVQVQLNCKADPEEINAANPDAVILATGSAPFIPNIPRDDNSHIVLANDVLSGKANTGKQVVVIGGGLVGAETAEHLAVHNRQVTLIEAAAEIVSNLENGPKRFLKASLDLHKVNIYVNTVVSEIRARSVIMNTKDTEVEIPADTIVIAIGSRSINGLAKQVEPQVSNVYTIGDARQPGRALEAIHEAYDLAMQI